MAYVTWKEFVAKKLAESELPKDVDKARGEAGGSNVGKERETSHAGEGPFCGPSGGAPKGSFPVTNAKQAHAAKSYAHNAPNPSGVKACADRVAKKHGW